jgi:hypothetical protein
MLAALIVALAASRDLPHQVDLRPVFERNGLTVCRQSGPLCWDYTVVGLLECELAQAGAAKRLSPGYLLWAAEKTDRESNAGSNFGRAERGLRRFGIAPLVRGGEPDLQGHSPAETQDVVDDAQDLGVVETVWLRFWNASDRLTADQFRAIRENLAEGHAVGIGMRWPNRYAETSQEPHMMSVPEPGKVFDGHCVALVGYRDDERIAGGGAFLFRNSWGANWGDAGYAWMPYEVLNRYVNDVVAVHLHPPLAKPTGDPIGFEAEDLKISSVRGPAPEVQDMTSRRGQWGGGQQLLFRGARSGDGFTLALAVSERGRYELRLLLTRAEEYGRYLVFVDGKKVSVADGAGPGISRAPAVPISKLDLKAGKHSISFLLEGKGSASSNTFFGLDAIQLVPCR